ncbi:MAG: hypothetical protein AW09_003754 [Candidatus Accumulibacter phosphatis]|uniref:Uncharacterized protein n=1 Tax=Candidatus Accumulibacter phosphatis TaxID=327160 RepID=A0A080LS49_9PROT|nr:MAG: hypothetical protein AW09_003754 [Candidatus Accumulibacter phosphatis]
MLQFAALVDELQQFELPVPCLHQQRNKYIVAHYHSPQGRRPESTVTTSLDYILKTGLGDLCRIIITDCNN